MIEVSQTPRERIDSMMTEVMRKHLLTEDEFFGQTRDRHETMARVECARRLRDFGLSEPRIAKTMKRDRKTIAYYLRLRDSDAERIVKASVHIPLGVREMLARLAMGQRRTIDDIIVEWVTERAMAEQARLQMLEAA
jgi:hypothetical protein